MSQVTKEQELQNQVILLKARLFDLQDQAGEMQAQGQEMQTALGMIAELVGVVGDGKSVQLQDVVDGVKALVPAQGELDIE